MVMKYHTGICLEHVNFRGFFLHPRRGIDTGENLTNDREGKRYRNHDSASGVIFFIEARKVLNFFSSTRHSKNKKNTGSWTFKVLIKFYRPYIHLLTQFL
jgi:hypothetical protein